MGYRSIHRNAVDAAARSMHAGGIMAFPGVAPIDHIESAVWAKLKIQSAEEGVCSDQEIGLMTTDKPRSISLQSLDVGAATVHIQREEFVSVGFRPARI
jgi:hypothetical protein